jgi:hypothetical protein
MASKSERFELRLNPDVLERVDEWRTDQADIPSRSEAVRRLLERGLAASDKQTYTLMRFQILKEALSYFLSPDSERPLDSLLRHFLPGDIFCWKRNIFPMYDTELAKAFAEQFDVTSSMMDDLSSLLCELFENKKTITFYQLLEHFQVKERKSRWSRRNLIFACRYLCDHHDFDDEFWTAMLSHAPIEADIIKKEILDEEALKGSASSYRYP